MLLKKVVKAPFFFGNGRKIAAVLYSTEKNFGDIRKRETETDKFRLLKAFAPKRNTFLELHKYNPLTFDSDRLFVWKDKLKKEADIYNQRYLKERHELLGNDLATAHFVVFRGCKVKFKDSCNWIKISEDDEHCNDLPNKFVRNLYLESIDASSSKIRYEGLVNFVNLVELKWLSFNNCAHVDDWFVDRLSGLVKDSVQYLDLSNCFNVTENSISCFYRFKNLKHLVLHNIVRNKQFEFSCMLLEDAFPHLVIDTRNDI